MKKGKSHYCMTRSEHFTRMFKRAIGIGFRFPLTFLVSIFITKRGNVEQAVLELIKELYEGERGIPPVSSYVFILREGGDVLGKYKGIRWPSSEEYEVQYKNNLKNVLRKRKLKPRLIIEEAHYMSVRRVAKSLERKGIVYSKMFECDMGPQIPVIDRKGNAIEPKPCMDKYIFLVKK